MFGINDEDKANEDKKYVETHDDSSDSGLSAYKISGSGPSHDTPQAGLADDSPQDDVPAPSSLPGVSSPSGNTDELFQLKQKALQKLAPLVNHLDQSPEEKFKTTMMLIQASDNADLLEEAYSAANAITDEKARAEALLNVVNEINYFTQKSEQ